MDNNKISLLVKELFQELDTYSISVVKIGNETILYYEEMQAPSIKNEDSLLKKLRKERGPRPPHSELTKKKISDAMKGHIVTDIHRNKIAARYYQRNKPE